ncbi:hypothetical protein COY95_04085, partial [Candidatus Woesearchaeota archaeon CG_4_10_14_0_8_um_filter_47_5]
LTLKKARVLVVGAGGLGSPVALYLAIAGVGTIGILDPDVVSLDNLHRQILHTLQSVNTPKVDSAAKTLSSRNPFITVLPFTTRLTSSTASSFIRRFDIILDCSDNFPTRYLIDDTCHAQRKPHVWGAVSLFRGRTTIFLHNRGPCYRCISPQPPPDKVVPSPGTEGIMGVLPGIIGLVMATEALKYILSIGTLLTGRMLSYDALSLSFSEYTIRKNPHCPLCSRNSSPSLRKTPKRK